MREHNDCRSGFDVSVLGLGAMGTIMARAFLKQGKRVAIWNRSPEKARALVDAGAHLFEYAQAALKASPVAILVLLDDVVVQELLGADGMAPALANCTIVNFSTGSAEQNLAVQALVSAAGGHYLKGMIVAYPCNVGYPESYCLYTGEYEGFERHRALLEALAGHALFLPRDEALAFAIMLHAHSFAVMVAFYEIVGASQNFGMPISKTARLLADASRFLISDAREDAARRFEAPDFAGDQARLDVHASAFNYIAESMHPCGARTPVFDAVCQVLQRAQSVGFGVQDIAAATKSFAPEAADSLDSLGAVQRAGQ